MAKDEPTADCLPCNGCGKMTRIRGPKAPGVPVFHHDCAVQYGTDHGPVFKTGRK